MKGIRIIGVPPGQAPLWVRQQWVGLEFPVRLHPENSRQFGVRGGKPENGDGHSVMCTDAIAALEKKNPKAARWFKLHLPRGLVGDLVFAKDVCQVIAWSGWPPGAAAFLDKLYAKEKVTTVEEKIALHQRMAPDTHVSSSRMNVQQEQILAVFEHEVLENHGLIDVMYL